MVQSTDDDSNNPRNAFDKLRERRNGTSTAGGQAVHQLQSTGVSERRRLPSGKWLRVAATTRDPRSTAQTLNRGGGDNVQVPDLYLGLASTEVTSP